MPKIKARIKKQGNSYAFFVPKALVDTNVLNTEDEYIFEIKKKHLKNNENIKVINGGVFQSNFSYINITNNNVGVAL